MTLPIRRIGSVWSGGFSAAVLLALSTLLLTKANNSLGLNPVVIATHARLSNVCSISGKWGDLDAVVARAKYS